MTKLSPLLASAALFTSLASAQLYHEPFRPQTHYSPQKNWMNDPNGLVYFQGEYHLFYQYNPKGDLPANISWGHAVSTDLLHWQELPLAIPATPDTLIFTGSVVVDEKNTSGLCNPGTQCLVAIYTGHHPHDPAPPIETQDIAVSQDRGRTWQKFAGNPVLDRHMANFRDPDVSWNDQMKSWLMAVALPDDHKVLFYDSPDLKSWTLLSEFGPAGTVAGQWECPTLVQIPSADGRTGTWALKVGLNPGSLQGGSGEQYFLGNFDGKRFIQSTRPGAHGWSDYGKDSYCAVSYNHLPAGEKPTLIGWMNNWQYAQKVPTSPWRGQMGMPRHLTFVEDQDGQALRQEPLTNPLRVGSGIKRTFEVKQIESFASIKTPFEVRLDFKPGDAERVGVKLYSDANHYTEIGFNLQSHTLYLDRTKSGLDVGEGFSGKVEAPIAAHRGYDLRIVIDRASVEVFAQDGTVAMTDLVFPTIQTIRPELFQTGANKVAVESQMWQLQSIWK